MSENSGTEDLFQQGRDAIDSGDYAKAVELLNKAAEQGHEIAQSNLGFLLGYMYLNGMGVPKNPDEAVKWYTKAADGGNSFAQNSLGNIYIDGKDVPKNPEQAIKYYTMAAEQGNVYSQTALAVMYHQGDGVDQDYVQAFKFYSDVANADQEDPDEIQFIANAMGQLGTYYYTGCGVKQDNGMAIEWMTKAADLGSAYAQYSMAQHFLYGTCGLERNESKAKEWLEKAAAQGFAEAIEALKLI